MMTGTETLALALLKSGRSYEEAGRASGLTWEEVRDLWHREARKERIEATRSEKPTPAAAGT